MPAEDGYRSDSDPGQCPGEDPGRPDADGTGDPAVDLAGEVTKDQAYRRKLESWNNELLRANANLDTAREQFSQMFDSAPVGYLALDERGRILKLNTSACDLLGASASDLLNSQLHRFLVPSHRDRFFTFLEALLVSGSRQECEFHLVAGAAVLDVVAHGTVLENFDQNAITCLVALIDITQRHRTEREREVAVDLLRQLNACAGTDDLIATAITFFRRLSGCEAIGVRLRDGDDCPYYKADGFKEGFVLAENRLCVYDEQGDVVCDQTGHPVLECMCGNVISGRFDSSKPFFTARGSFWTDSTSELLDGATDAEPPAHTRNRCCEAGYESLALLPLCMGEERIGLLQLNDSRKGLFTSHLIAEWERLTDHLAVSFARLRAEQALQAKDRQYRDLVENAGEGIFSVDASDCLTFVNQRMADMVGRNPAEMVGQPLLSFVSPQCVGAAEGGIRACREGRTHHVEVDLRSKDNLNVPVRFVGWPISGPDGDYHGATVFVTDISEQRQLRSQLQQLQRLEAIGGFVGDISHEFRNLLMAISAHAEVLHAGLGPEHPQTGVTNDLLHCVDIARKLIDKLLTFGRRQTMDVRLIDLNDVVAELEKLLRRLMGPPYAVDVRLSAHRLLVNADPGQVEQAVLNMAINARDAMPEGGTLVIRTERCSQVPPGGVDRSEGAARLYAEIGVEDTGIGMDDSTREHVFEPFFTTKETENHVGLGLSVAYGIAHQHGGHIEVTSRAGAGSRFALRLPLVDTTSDQLRTAESASSTKGKETILVVEDEELVRLPIMSILEANGYDVLGACDGDEAVRVFRASSRPIDLVVTDLVMPTAGGARLYSMIKQDAPRTRFLFISAHLPSNVLPDMQPPPHEPFMSKPFSLFTLALKVREILDAR